MTNIRYIICVFLWLATLSGNAQQLLFTNVSNRLQIPSPECYNILQDSKGYIWFGTDAGLCRYDGTFLHIFDNKNGLPESSIYTMLEDENHTLWFVSSKSRILRYTGDSLQEIKLGKKYEAYVNGRHAIPCNISYNEESEIYINFNSGTYKIDLKNSKNTGPTDSPVRANYVFIKKENGGLIRIFPQKFVPHTNIIKISVIGKGAIQEIIFPKSELIYPHWRTITHHVGNTNFISVDGKLIKIDNNKNLTTFDYPGRILCLYTDKDNGLWVGTYKSGLYYYPDINHMQNPLRSLCDISISGVVVDHENNIWCSSLEKGILFCYNKNIIDYSNVDGLEKSIDLLKNEDGRIFVSSDMSTLFEIGKSTIKHDLKIKIASTIYDIKKSENGWLLGGSNMFIKANHKLNNIDYIKDNEGYSALIYEIIKTKEKVYGLSYQNIIKYNGSKISYIKMPFTFPAKSFLHDHDEVFYIGSSSGLHKVNFEDQSYITIKKNVAVSKIIRSHSGNIWYTTKGNGVHLIANNYTYSVSSLLNIPTDFYYDITEDKNNNIWVASNVGLIKININKKKYDIINTLSGLPSNIINKVAVNDEQVFIATAEGLYSFPLEKKFENDHKPDIYVNSIYINGEKINKNEKNIILPYNRNSIRILFDAITFKNFTRKELVYQLEGRDGSFQKITGNEIILDNLPPNKYKLEVYATNHHGYLSKEPIILLFEIKKPFWKTLSFIIVSTIIACILFYFFIKKIIDNIKKKEADKTQINKLMAEYQLSAVQAQMNPHFIFNAINSIQSYILQKNEQQAYDYLAKFSKLIRMVLNNSEEKILSLYQELQTLDLYIQLEMLRFDDKFEYILNISKEVNQHDVYVPAMLIQPYVENAIWHGLMNLDNRKGILKIDVSIEKENLFISIYDNGVGREMAAQYKKNTDHKSIGMKLNQKRLTMINQLKDFEDAKVLVVDLSDVSGNANGTRIEIYIPIN
jgi:hypothetical protein